MEKNFKNLFTPIKIGNMTVPNRVVQVPTDISTGDSDGAVNDRVIAYHEELAKGGTGLIIVGASTPDRETGRPTVTCLSVDADFFIPGLHRLAHAMQKHGAKCAVQIQHPGRQAAYPRKNQMSCSDMISDLPGSAGHEVIYAGDTAQGKIAREMSVDEVYDLIEKFAEAAWRVQQAGFDCVELHGAHGYLIAQFMSPYTNKRNDRFGATLTGRMRFPLEIIDRIKRKCGPNFPILVRYSGEEWMPGSRFIDESKEIAKMFEAAGVAALDISAGIFDAPGPTMDPMYYEEGWNTYTSEAVKSVVSIPVITSHTLRSPEYCDKIIGEGKTDMAGLSRQLIADPYWANKAKAGKPEEIRKCISCLIGCWKESLMIKREMRCAINPAVGDMRFLDIQSAKTQLKAAIIGGGIAGMEAARIAALRGHKVTILEKDNELGGILRTCCMVPAKQKMKWYMDWIRRQIAGLGIEVRLNVDAAKEDLSKFDVVLAGTGGKTFVPDIPGADKAVKFEDVLICARKNCEFWPKEGKPEAAKTGQKVIVWGNHYAASDTAEALAIRGREVILVTEDAEFCPDIEPIHREVMKMRFAGGNAQGLEGTPIKIPVVIHTKSTILEIKADSVVLMDANFRKEVIKADTVILAKQVPDDTLFNSLRDKGLKIQNIGDSRAVMNVRNAMTNGAEAGLLLDEGIFMNANGILSGGLPLDVEKQMAR
ncbi:MAG: NAD(P)/FAD-dependent oxidoreductase [Treponema sp.]|jgi:2,4-dienoyl-CoA reductase-like NADH-dependent reductase (Old Yellow Enzyme family)/thioredoxin reductase|nr:NAD(P)/FAD-dependent oxidoreductase [Treponema sp.]